MIKGKDVKIHKTAIIKRPKLVKMGNHIAIDPFFYMTTKATFGDNIHISSHVSVIGGEQSILIVKDEVAISTGCRLVCKSEDFATLGHAIPWLEQGHAQKYGSSIIIHKGVILGANVTVLPGVMICEGAVVGAGSVVNKDLDPFGIYVGSPAKKIGVRK